MSKLVAISARAVLSEDRQGASVAQHAGPCSGQSPSDLFLEYFLNLPDLFFDFAGPVFGFALGL